MLTLLALSAVLLQDPPAPPQPPHEPETRVMIMGGPGGPGGPGHLDKDGDGQVSREEFSAPMNDAFARMDANGDGRLSTEELAAGHRAMADGDGNVMFMRHPGGPEGGPDGVRHFEFRRGGPEGGPGERREERVVVIGGDGHGDHGMPMMMMDGPGHDGPGGERMEIHRLGGGEGHDDMDKNGDGKISEDEFIGPMRDAFARMDADHSGFIESGEHGEGNQVHVFTRHAEHTDGDHDGDHH